MNDNEYKFECYILKKIYFNPDNNWGSYTFSTNTKLPHLKKINDSENSPYWGFLNGKVGNLIINNKYLITAQYQMSRKNDMTYHNYAVLNITTDLSTQESKDNFLRNITTDRQFNSIKENCPEFIDKAIHGEDIDHGKIKYIGEKTLKVLVTKLKTDYWKGDLIEWLRPFNVTSNMIDKLLEAEKSSIVLREKIENNPYELVKIPGLGFTRVDDIVCNLYPEKRNTIYRLREFISHYLKEVAFKDGHTIISIKKLKEECDIKVPECMEHFNDIMNLDEFKSFDDYIGLDKYFREEKQIIDILKKLQDAPSKVNMKEKDVVKWFVDNMKINITEEQKEAILAPLKHNVVFITGSAGTGKTISINGIIYLFEAVSKLILSFTARAAGNVREKTGHEAFTIHRGLGVQKKGFKYNEKNPLPYPVVIMEEQGSVNNYLTLSVLKAIEPGHKIIFVGDHGQLPAIGPGNMFGDIIEYCGGMFPIYNLTKTYRQAENSAILMDAIMIRNKKNPFGSDDVPLNQIITRGKKEDIHYKFVENKDYMFKHAIAAYVKGCAKYGVDETALIIPRKQGILLSADNFNNSIQNKLIDIKEKFVVRGQRKFRISSKLIQKQNDYLGKGVINGDIGYLKDIDEEEKIFTVEYNFGNVEYTFTELNQLELAYALTIHSMQGSQMKFIIVVVDSSHSWLLSNEMLYTAITRASEKLYIIANKKAFDLAIKKSASKRNTFMQNIIKGTIKLFLSL